MNPCSKSYWCNALLRRASRANGILVALLMVLLLMPPSTEGQYSRSADLDRRIKQARTLERLRQYDQAATLFERILQEAPDNRSALAILDSDWKPLTKRYPCSKPRYDDHPITSVFEANSPRHSSAAVGTAKRKNRSKTSWTSFHRRKRSYTRSPFYISTSRRTTGRFKPTFPVGTGWVNQMPSPLVSPASIPVSSTYPAPSANMSGG